MLLPKAHLGTAQHATRAAHSTPGRAPAVLPAVIATACLDTIRATASNALKAQPATYTKRYTSLPPTPPHPTPTPTTTTTTTTTTTHTTPIADHP